MAKLCECDNCACQGICKIEDDYRMISKNMDQVFEKALRFNNLITEENKNGNLC